jgi:hypothetical protein
MAGRISYYGNIIKDGLVLDLDAGKLQSYPRTGTLWNDVSGQGSVSTLVNGVTYSSSNGGVFVFDGIDDSARFLSTTTYQNFTNATFSIWCTFSTTVLDKIYTLMSNSIQSSNNHFWFYYDKRSAVPSFVNKWGFDFGNGVTRSNISSTSTFIPTLNTWYNLVATFDNGSVVIYVNGVSVGSGSGVTTIAGSNAQIYTGGYFLATGAGVQFTWPGNLNQHLIYRKTLSATEVLQNFNATRSRYGV